MDVAVADALGAVADALGSLGSGSGSTALDGSGVATALGLDADVGAIVVPAVCGAGALFVM